MRSRHALFILALGSAFGAASAQAQLTSPQIGWQADLSQDFHDVSGTVTILDEDTVQVDNFTYDGAGIVVYFYLGEEDSTPAFTSGLEIGPDLFGTAFDGSQAPLVYDLPAGQTMEGWNAISVWCVTAGVSFGSGTFEAVTSGPAGDFNGDQVVDAADYTVWRDNLGAPYTQEDYAQWRDNYGATSALSPSATLNTIPEPSAALALTWGMAALLRRSRHAARRSSSR